MAAVQGRIDEPAGALVARRHEVRVDPQREPGIGVADDRRRVFIEQAVWA
jgi:hypothetical protein